MDPTNQKKQQQEPQQQQQQQEHSSPSDDPSECDVDSTIQRLKEHGYTNYEVSIIFGNLIQGGQRTYIEPFRKTGVEDCYYPGLLLQEPSDSSAPIRMYDFSVPMDYTTGHPVVFSAKKDPVRKIISRRKKD